MTDLLERLRAENPVPECPPPPLEDVWRKLDADRGSRAPRLVPAALAPRRRARWPWLQRSLILTLSVVPVIAVIVLATRAGTPSTAARVLSATDSTHAIVHYVADITQRDLQGQAGPAHHTRWEVWLAGNRAHVLLYQARRSGRFLLRAEIAVGGNHIELYRPGEPGTIYKGVVPRGSTSCTPSLTTCGFQVIDPVALLRKLAIGRSLRQAGKAVVAGRNATVLENQGNANLLMPASRWTLQLRALVDRNTFVPIEIATTFGSGGKPVLSTTSTITSYERLPITAQSDTLLDMAPHPHTPVQCGVFEPDGSIGYPCPNH